MARQSTTGRIVGPPLEGGRRLPPYCTDDAGEGALSWTPGAVVDWRFGSGALLSLNAGLWLRPGREFAGVRWGNAATFGLGAEVPIVRRRGITAV